VQLRALFSAVAVAVHSGDQRWLRSAAHLPARGTALEQGAHRDAKLGNFDLRNEAGFDDVREYVVEQYDVERVFESCDVELVVERLDVEVRVGHVDVEVGTEHVDVVERVRVEAVVR
jgi:hypothetical protein